MTLLEHIRTLNQAAVTPMPFGMDWDNSPIDQDLAAGYAFVTVSELIKSASDADIVEAYRQLNGDSDAWASGFLTAEIRLRCLEQ